MIEFADLQCPYCHEYAVNALPAIVKEYVRTGKVKLVFFGMAFIGPDSDKALRARSTPRGSRASSGTYLDLLYRNQGAENSGWVTDACSGRPGLDPQASTSDKMLADRELDRRRHRASPPRSSRRRTRKRELDADVLRRGRRAPRSST